MLDYYHTPTKPMRRQLFFQRKRPKEEWDHMLLEIPLQPLPKRNNAHWDPNEWEIWIK